MLATIGVVGVDDLFAEIPGRLRATPGSCRRR